MKFKKIYVLITKNFYNFGINKIIRILLVLYSTYIGFRDQNKFIFYVKNNINSNLFNQLYVLC